MRQVLSACNIRVFVALLSVALLAAGTLASRAQAQADPCLTPLLEDQPLCNPALSPTEWPISHSTSYAQGSSPYAGPTPEQSVVAEHVDLLGPPITLATGPRYPDDGMAIWGAVLGPSAAVFKLDHDTFTVIDSYVPADEEVSPPAIPLGVSGAYSVADPNFNFILGRADFVEIFRDSVPGDRSSEIELAKRVFLPSSAFCRSSDLLVGGVMLSDGMLAFATEQAVLGLIPSDIDQMDPNNVIALPSENGADCTNLAIPDEDLETVSNSIAADENGGIYLVTDAAVIKYEWDGSTLQKLWRAEYASDPPFSVLRLGPGSGSTPSLMGTELDDDRFVVITDGQELMHLVLMWRDEIPLGWQPIAPGKDPRIACEVPIRFGDPAATQSLSEQSVLVRGNAAIVVSNLLRDETGLSNPVPALSAALAALEGGNPDVAPFGIERVDWDPNSQTCATVWTNSELSLPNSIPTMSAATGLMYALGQRGGAWGLEAIDFETGESKMFVASSQLTCSQEVLDAVADSILGPLLTPVIERLPASCENSIFAATEVGPDGSIYQGTFQGTSRFKPDAVFQVPPRRHMLAGVRQGIDLVGRGMAGTDANDVEATRDASKRGQVQLGEVLALLGTAAVDGSLDSGSAAEATTHVSAAEAHFAAAEAAVDSDLGLAESEITDALSDLTEGLDWLTPCPPAPQTDCRIAEKSSFKLKFDGDKSKLVWSWKSGIAIDPETLPDPRTRAEYALCVYDESGAVRSAELQVPPDRTAWKGIGKFLGYKYKDKLTANAGISKMIIKEKPGKNASAKVIGKGTSIPTLSLPLTTPVTVQLINGETGLCWDASYAGGDIKKNEPARFQAKSKTP